MPTFGHTNGEPWLRFMDRALVAVPAIQMRLFGFIGVKHVHGGFRPAPRRWSAFRVYASAISSVDWRCSARVVVI